MSSWGCECDSMQLPRASPIWNRTEFVHGRKSIIGECDAVRVAAQILKHLCRTRHRALGMATKGCARGSLSARAGVVNRSALRCYSQTDLTVLGRPVSRKVLPRNTCERPDRKKAAFGSVPESGTRGTPPMTSACTWMRCVSLTPRCAGSACTDHPRAAGWRKLQQCLRRGRSGNRRSDAGSLGQRIELMRQCEHHMKIRCCNQVTPTGLKPAFLRSSLTLRAMAVPTGMVDVA